MKQYTHIGSSSLYRKGLVSYGIFGLLEDIFGERLGNGFLSSSQSLLEC